MPQPGRHALSHMRFSPQPRPLPRSDESIMFRRFFILNTKTVASSYNLIAPVACRASFEYFTLTLQETLIMLPHTSTQRLSLGRLKKAYGILTSATFSTICFSTHINAQSATDMSLLSDLLNSKAEYLNYSIYLNISESIGQGSADAGMAIDASFRARLDYGVSEYATLGSSLSGAGLAQLVLISTEN